MPSDIGAKQPAESAGYGYSYGGSYAGYSAVGYGYGDGGGGGNQTHRSFQDYLLILRERIWYVVVVFLVVFSSALVYTLSETKIFESTATVQIFRRETTPIGNVERVVDNDIRGTEDLNTQVQIIQSAALIRSVAERITGDDLKAFLAPYEKTSADSAFVGEILAKNRKVVPQRLTLVVAVTYQHPDRFVAAKVANLFVDEYLMNIQRVRSKFQTTAVRDLQITVEDQQKVVDAIAQKIQAYKERNKTVSLDQRKNIIDESLKALNLEVQHLNGLLQAATVRLDQVKEYKAKGLDLTGLPFIASSPHIIQLKQQVAAHQIEIAKLGERYRAPSAKSKGHPNMIQALNSFEQTKRELDRAIVTVCDQVDSEYRSALTNYEAQKRELGKQKEESLELDRLSVEYTKLEREYQTQNTILQSIAARRTETSMTTGVDAQNAQYLDHAAPAAENKPSSPKIPLNLGLGVAGGLALGLAFAFFVAFIDDRVKSSYDIEGVVGLPLIGIIPQIKRMDQADKAQIVANNADRQVAEAFLTLHSSLRLKDESKNAKCILTTSTVPGEGKSFTTTNLALTFAAHGEKVIIVDCDLRKPNIHKSFRIENLRGVIDICAGKASIDEVVVKGLHPNLDVLPAGGRAKNPTQILNSKAFEIMISDLRKKYDRVFVDTPPLAAVSDALIILPLVDGSIFTIFFNKVRRKAAQFSAKRLLEANVPNFGAVLNGLNLAVSGYYYAQYYDKSYKDYYVVMAKSEDAEEEK
jgi:capsular exopolysaccharide synthesis family protein